MLCYLAIISEQIQSSKDNRVMLEQIYNETNYMNVNSLL